MVDLKALLTSKKELAARLIALGIFGELANLIIFLTGTENHEALDDIEEEEGDLRKMSLLRVLWFKTLNNIFVMT